MLGLYGHWTLDCFWQDHLLTNYVWRTMLLTLGCSTGKVKSKCPCIALHGWPNGQFTDLHLPRSECMATLPSLCSFSMFFQFFRYSCSEDHRSISLSKHLLEFDRIWPKKCQEEDLEEHSLCAAKQKRLKSPASQGECFAEFFHKHLRHYGHRPKKIQWWWPHCVPGSLFDCKNLWTMCEQCVNNVWTMAILRYVLLNSCLWMLTYVVCGKSRS